MTPLSPSTVPQPTAAAGYIGRFAPSPTGPLHAGSLVAALASYLDARAHQGRWLLRIEDIDTPRVQKGATEAILAVLSQLGMQHDGEPSFQSAGRARYAAALDRLRAAGQVYPCGCTRAELADSRLNWGTSGGADRGAAAKRSAHAGDEPPGRELIYPGTCRHGLPSGRSARSWRVRVPASPVLWRDRSGRTHHDDLQSSVGDFVVYRADGIWAYQLAVVVDDGFQSVTDVVRGCDLEGSTSRQIHLQQLLGLPRPRYLHIPVVLAANGQKLSKQTGAAPIDLSQPVRVLNDAMRHLGLEPIETDSLTTFWDRATERWATSAYLQAATRPAASPDGSPCG
ncbi:MAG: tRNA glutamyl-Q(34) synthetase GluQRS [Betaproteobacteria bacterium]|nr:tRNA glutamyl-Q(34) synthetase GluQRS [Betaproteobacteria bacterium]